MPTNLLLSPPIKYFYTLTSNIKTWTINKNQNFTLYVSSSELVQLFGITNKYSVEKYQKLYCCHHPPIISTHWHLTQTHEHFTIT
jgi:hypothetical protein